MSKQSLSSHQKRTKDPFWIDEPNPYIQSKKNQEEVDKRLRLFFTLMKIYSALLGILFVVILAWFLAILFGKISGWVFAIYLIAVAALTFYGWRRGKTLIDRTTEIQARAKEISGAETIGSAIHTAGHPLLQVDQPVVLALTEDHLSVYSYQKDVPLDTISLHDIQAVDLVTYDDEGTPHLGVVNPAAQALQLSFCWRGQDCACLFRRMYKIRAVGWYQAIQRGRLSG